MITPGGPADAHRELIGRIEAAIHVDVGRGMNAIFQASKGALWRAGSALAASGQPTIGLITGFFVPAADPAAAETDGPGAAALLALAFQRCGLRTRVATDTMCATACRAAMEAAGVADIAIDAAEPGGAVNPIIDLWRGEGVDWVIAIERCGPAADGRSYNMRGRDISAYASPMEQLFSAGPWRTLAIGDGGNEMGMGSIARTLIAGHVPMGEMIGCVVPADFLVTAGVSHWGAYAILAALSVLRPAWQPGMVAGLQPELDRSVIETMVLRGPAVDGVSLRQEVTIDALEMEFHHQVLARINALIRAPGTGGPASPDGAT